MGTTRQNVRAWLETRERPVLTARDVPQEKLAGSSAGETFKAVARPGEYYPLQVVVCAAEGTLYDVRVDYADLRSEQGGTIPASGMTCLQTAGNDYQGRIMRKKVAVPHGNVQAMWVGIEVPESTPPGVYEGVWKVLAEGAAERQLDVKLCVEGEPLPDAGDGELWRLSRLRWLNSDIAADEEVTAPYTAVKVAGRTVSCLGRTLTFGDTGFPERVVSYFSPSVDGLQGEGRDIIASPITLIAETAESLAEEWRSLSCGIAAASGSAAEWQAASESERFEMIVRAGLEYDGYVWFQVTLKAKEAVRVRDIRLDIPVAGDVARYGMGMGKQGGRLPESLEWKWDASVNQDSFWLGDVNAGLRCQLKGENYRKPFVNIYYRHRPLLVPGSWDNGGKGGAALVREDGAVKFRAFSGEREIEAGSELHYNFDLMITPLKPIDMTGHWNNRYYHRPPEKTKMETWQQEALEHGANVINIHHGAEAHPFINYPFYETDNVKAFVAEAHGKGLKTKLYYTVREMTDHMAELKALRSLGDEIFPPPNGSAASILWQGDAAAWVREHLGDDVIPAWKHEFAEGKYAGAIDAAIISDGTSRMVNYYLEGLQWLLRETDIDGIYIDDVAYDRTTIRRARKVLDRAKSGCLIDFHTWNHMNDLAGFCSNANLYMELFPYLDSLWIGEGFDYNAAAPDYWLIEISGIPFGLMGEMLQGGGNPWRGMAYGMTNRLGWHGQTPKHLWRLWDGFRIQDAEMLGYWHPENPVRTGRDDVLATVYKREDELLISLASWAGEPVTCSLEVDWAKLGWDAGSVRCEIPPIPDFQEEQAAETICALRLEPGKGLLLRLYK
ncbi:glycoside hydrolase domain-containing protein [Paenibacillus sp. MBLB4367]|uniref:glycoside hydrolase domain-containing protein n=1 Tax=Paenibacillus sp. MBLB4367 TaxID=3384767 RepID=UPI0039080A94